MSLLSAIKTGFKFIGKIFVGVEEWVPKIIGIAAYSEQESKVIIPAFVTVFQDVEDLAKLALSDAEPGYEALLTMVQAIEGLAGAGALNPAEYAKVISAVSSFITCVHGTDYTTLFKKVTKLVADFDAMGAEAKTALDKVAAIAKSPAEPAFTITGPAGDGSGPITVTN